MLKKINAVLAFVTAALTLSHVVTMGLQMLKIVGYSPVFGTVGTVLLRVFTVHIALSLVIMFFGSGKGVTYPKLNKATIEQRIAAIILLLLIHFHMGNYMADGVRVAQSVFGFVTEILFAVCVMCHYMPSLDRGLTTLGICKKPLIIAIRVISLLAYLFTLTAICVYFLGALI